MATQIIPTGTVSERTHQPLDLVDAFMAFMQEYAPEKRAEVLLIDGGEIGHLWVTGKLHEKDRGEGLSDEEHEELGNWLNEDIWSAMEDLAPDGYSFGASEGDGADFGYWAEDEDEG